MIFNAYENRAEAGRVLADRLSHYRGERIVVLALIRGGMPVAYEVAEALDAPLDVMLVRKLGVPQRPELAFGAIASGGVVVLNEHVVEGLALTDADLKGVVAREQAALEEREERYRGDRPAVPLARRTVILVDDGLATGASMRAAIEATRARQPRKIVVAVPVGSGRACEEIAELADEVVCPLCTEEFFAVSQFYRDFSQVDDLQVRAYLQQGHDRIAHAG